MRIFLTGISGLLGINAAIQLRGQHEVSGAYFTHPVQLQSVDAFPVDLTDQRGVRELFGRVKPQVVLHTAGLANVDKCEDSPLKAEQLHVKVSENVACAAVAVGASLVHISTDHLGDGNKAFVEEEHLPLPINHYAKTKWLAEKIVTQICSEALIIRTNFFGWGSPVKPSFSDWVLQGLKEARSLPLFVDVYITPILINDLVDLIVELIQRGASGVFNVVGRERVSKCEFGRQLANVFGYPGSNLRPISVRDVSLRAPRPMDMSLSTDKVTNFVGRPMPGLQDSFQKLKTFEEQDWPRIIRHAMGFGEDAADR